MDERDKIAREIVQKIVEDLTCRNGLENEWDSIDEAMRIEIIKEWEMLAWGVLREHFI